MKNVYLILFILFISTAVFGQSKKSTTSFVLGGSFSYWVANHDSEEEFRTSRRASVFSPYFGRAIGDNFIIGLSAEFEKWTDNEIFIKPEEYNYNIDYEGFGLGLFMRYTMRPDKDFSFFIQPYASILNYRDSFDTDVLSGDRLDEGFRYSVGTDVGFKYDFNSTFRAIFNWGGIEFNRTQIENIGFYDESSNNFSVSLGNTYPKIGFEIKL